MTNTSGLFGTKKFGAIQFGATTLTRDRYVLEVDWDRDGLFSGASEARWMVAYSRQGGRKHLLSTSGDGFEEEATGKITIVLWNENRRYDAWNTESALYPYVSPGPEYRMWVRSSSGAVYARARGFINDIQPFTDGNVDYVKLDCDDLWSFLRDADNDVTVDLQQDITAAEAISAILDTVGWRWGREIDAGIDDMDYWWVQSTSPAKSIHNVGFAELGKIWLDGAGTLHFQNRYSPLATSLVLTDDDIVDGSLKPYQPWEVVKNKVTVTATPRTIVSNTTLWQATEIIRLLPGEETDTIWCSYSYNNETVPAINQVTPVATTDYTANTAQDGSGTNMTSYLQPTIYFYAIDAALKLKNTSGSTTIYVTMFKFRGDAIAAGNTMRFKQEDSTSQRLYGKRELKFDSPLIQDSNRARLFSELLLNGLKDPKGYYWVELKPIGDLPHQVETGLRVDLTSDSKNISGAFRVIYLSQSIDDRQSDAQVKTKILLEPYNALSPSSAQLPVQLPFQI